MRTSQATRYARWAAAAAILLTAVVAGVFFWRMWQARQAAQNAPPPVPVTVERRSEVFSFSKVEGSRTLFTLRASRATEFREGGKSLLEDVWITVYGREGKRFDNVHTAQCDYVATTGQVVCAGEVQMDLESAEEARARPGERAIHIRTANISFDRESGELRTERPVEFRFPYGQGRGVGVSYSTRQGVARILRDVQMTVSAAGVRAAAGRPLELTGAGLAYERDSRTMRLLGPVRARQGSRELTAGSLALEFTPQLRARRATATDRPQLRTTGGSDQMTLSAAELAVLFSPAGIAERLVADGDAALMRRNISNEDKLTAGRIEVEMAAEDQPRQLTAAGSVKFVSSERGELRQLETDTLQVFFVPPQGRSTAQIARAETPRGGAIELHQAGEITRVRAGRWVAEFAGSNRFRRLTGTSGTEIERRIGRNPAQNATARELTVSFDARGVWAEAGLEGDVRYREADRTAQAGKALLERVQERVTLTDNAVVSDSASRTTAQAISFNQRTGELAADGGVRTSYRAAGNGSSAPNLGSGPAHLTSDRLRGDRATSRASYAGHARLWQGDALIEADTMELDQRGQQLRARGNVQAVFPQATAATSGAASVKLPAQPGPVMWRVRAGKLDYAGEQRSVRLEENVVAESPAGRMACRAMDLFLAAAPGGAQQLTRALASGGVNIRQGERRGSAERAEYFASEGKFVLSGGTPTLVDPFVGTTTGRQLTFFLADDKILVESEEGSRTVTRHRVEK